MIHAHEYAVANNELVRQENGYDPNQILDYMTLIEKTIKEALESGCANKTIRMRGGVKPHYIPVINMILQSWGWHFVGLDYCSYAHAIQAYAPKALKVKRRKFLGLF